MFGSVRGWSTDCIDRQNAVEINDRLLLVKAHRRDPPHRPPHGTHGGSISLAV